MGVLSHVCNKFYRQTSLIWTAIRDRCNLVPRILSPTHPYGQEREPGNEVGVEEGRPHYRDTCILQILYARTGSGGVQEAGEERAVVGGSLKVRKQEK